LGASTFESNPFMDVDYRFDAPRAQTDPFASSFRCHESA